MYWILIFFTPIVWANIQEAELVTPAQPFWLSSTAKVEPLYPPTRNLSVGPWQTSYLFNEGVLTVGSRKFSENDPNFPARGAPCRETRGDASFAASSVRFCSENPSSTEASVRVNQEDATPQGNLALSGQPLILEVRWRSGKKIRLSLTAPDEPVSDIRRKSTGGWTLTEFGGPYQTRGKSFGAPSYPWTQREQITDIAEFPHMTRRRGPLGIGLQRIIESGDAVADSEQRLTLPSRQRLGGYSEESRFTLSTPEGKKEWKLSIPTYGTRWLELKSGERLWRVPYTRMPATELSGKFSGLLSGSSAFILTGEFLLVHNFSDRWSARARGYGGLYSTGEREVPRILFMSGEGRAMVRKGLWNLDDVWGVLVSGNKFQLIDSEQQFVGAGIFWSRSMPDGFDRWLRWAPIFRYPKYVDLDLAYLHPTGDSTNDSLNWIANFHGKMFLSPNWFFESGIGFFQLRTQNGRALSASLGTVGFGVLF